MTGDAGLTGDRDAGSANPGRSSASAGRLSVSCATEWGALRTVIMRLAHRSWLTPRQVTSHLNLSGFFQWRYNRYASFDSERVREQQLAFAAVLERHGATVVLIHGQDGSSSQHFVRDLGAAIDDTLVLARMGTSARRAEMRDLRATVERVPHVERLTEGRLECGDVMLLDDRVLVGHSERTDSGGVAALRAVLRRRGIEREVVELQFSHRGVIHLDTKLNVIGEGLALVHLDSFAPSSQAWLRQSLDLVEATDEEAQGLEINVVAIAPGTVVVQARSQRLASLLSARGLEVIPLDYSEVCKVPGAFRCTTLPLARGER